MNVLYQFNIAGAILTLVLLLVACFKRRFRSLQTKLFNLTLTLCFFSCLIEATTGLFLNGFINLPYWLNYFFNTLNLVIHCSVYFAYLIYILSIYKENASMKVEFSIFLVFTILTTVFILTNPLHNLIFTISPDQVFSLGLLSWITKVHSIILIFYALFKVVFGRKKFTLSQKVINVTFICLVVCGVVIEHFFQNIMIESFLITILFLMPTIIFDNHDQYFYKDTKVYNESGFTKFYAEKLRKKIPFKLIAYTYKDFELYEQKFGKKRTSVAIRESLLNSQKKYGKNAVFSFPRNIIVIDAKGLNIEKEMDFIAKSSYKGGIEHNANLKLIAQFAVIDVPDDVNTLNDIHNAIYTLLYQHHFKNGENVIYFDHKLMASKRREERIVMAIHDAIENDGFELYFQPIYDWKKNKFIALEALIRMKNKIDGEQIGPQEFIPIAEDNGLIFTIDEIVFEKVCRFSRNNNIEKYGIKFIDVNLSLLKLLDIGTVDRYVELISRYGLKPNFINLEITETAEGDEKYLATVAENIAKFREKGFCFSLDDYGSGYSTVIYMAEMDTKIVKIDASILWNAMKNKKYLTILENCVRLIYCFNKDCIVEGVENAEMVKVLQRLGVNYFQGYYYSKPLTETEIIKFLSSKNSV